MIIENKMFNRFVGALIFCIIYIILYFIGRSFSDGLIFESNPMFPVIIAVLSSLVLILIFVLHDEFFWKFPLINKFSNLNIAGQYEGEIEYEFDGKKGQKGCNMEIEQTFSTIKIRCDFIGGEKGPTKSNSLYAIFDYTNVHPKLVFIYRNDGLTHESDRLHSHVGCCELDIKKSDKEIELKGAYFTSRTTKGDLTVKKVMKK